MLKFEIYLLLAGQKYVEFINFGTKAKLKRLLKRQHAMQ